MINGNEYAFEDMQCVINGISLEGFVDVRYGATKEHTNIHGRGNRPVSMCRGKKDATQGKLTLLQSEFERLQAATPPGMDPTDWVPFTMTISYAPLGGVPVTDVVPFCRVSQWEKGMSTEDGNMTVELQLTTGIPQLHVS
jgi:hypothetical protein